MFPLEMTDREDDVVHDCIGREPGDVLLLLESVAKGWSGASLETQEAETVAPPIEADSRLPIIESAQNTGQEIDGDANYLPGPPQLPRRPFIVL